MGRGVSKVVGEGAPGVERSRSMSSWPVSLVAVEVEVLELAVVVSVTASVIPAAGSSIGSNHFSLVDGRLTLTRRLSSRPGNGVGDESDGMTGDEELAR